MFDYDFMVNAFAAATIVAIAAGLVGYFLVLRGQTDRKSTRLNSSHI